LKQILCRIAHPQSNGIIERYHRSTREALAEKPLGNYLQAQDIIAGWVEEYNEKRLHAGLNYLQPIEYFQGDPECRLEARRQKLEQARKARQKANEATNQNPSHHQN